MKVPVIAIDLGTTNSRVAIWQQKVIIIPDEYGNDFTPNVLSFSKSEQLIGASANTTDVNPKNVIYNVKRLIGLHNFNQKVQALPYKVISECESLKIKLEDECDVFLTPEEVTAMLLNRMKEIAEAYIGTTVRDAVVTVPGHFTDSQRQATLNAGTIAGLNVLRIINEPTAAALTYGLKNKLTEEKNILVFDLGGGKFNTSVLTIDPDLLIEVRASVGTSYLGGEDFTEKIMDYLIEKLQVKDVRSNLYTMKRIKIAAEEAKIVLSQRNETTIKLDDLFEGVDFTLNLTRKKFEELCSELFTNTINLVDKVLCEAMLESDGIDEIVLVGGSCHIPKIQSILTDYFNDKYINFTVNPSEAVVYGAAVEAAILSGEINSENINSKQHDILLVDIAAHSLGIQSTGGAITKIINKNTRIPFKQTLIFTTYTDEKDDITVRIIEGENNLLGNFILKHIPTSPRGISHIEVSFDIDANGILSVSAVDKTLFDDRNIEIIQNKGGLTERQITNYNNERRFNYNTNLNLRLAIK